MAKVNSFQALVSAIHSDFDFAIARYPHIGIILKHELSVVGAWSSPESMNKWTKITIHDPTFIQYAAFLGKTKALLKMIEIAQEQGLSIKQIFEPKTSNTKITVLNLIVYSGNNDCLRAVLNWLGDKNEEVNVNFAGDKLESPLSVAVDLSASATVKMLLEEFNADPLLNGDKVACALCRAISNTKGLNGRADRQEHAVMNLMYSWLRKASNLTMVKDLKWNNWKISESGNNLVDFLGRCDGYSTTINDLAGIWNMSGVDEKAIENTRQVKPQVQTPAPQVQVSDAPLCSECDANADEECPGCGKHFCSECINSHNC